MPFASVLFWGISIFWLSWFVDGDDDENLYCSLKDNEKSFIDDDNDEHLDEDNPCYDDIDDVKIGSMAKVDN